MIPVGHSLESKTIHLFILALLLFTGGCGGGGGGGPIGGNGNDTLSSNMTLVADQTLLEAGESTSFTISLRDSKGNFLQGQFIEFSVSNPANPELVIGWINPSRVRTDSTYENGMSAYPIFVSADTGSAVILVGNKDVGGNYLDSAEVQIDIILSTHFLSFIVLPDSVGLNEPAFFTCILAMGSQDNPLRTGGRTIRFESFDYNNRSAPFGDIIPPFDAQSDTVNGNGLNAIYTFQAGEAGIAFIKATYFNGIGQVAATGEAIVEVAE